VCLDTDVGLRNLDLALGLENRIVYDIVDVVEGRARTRQALIRDRRLSSLYLLPAAQTRDKTSISPAQMVALCAELASEFDYVLIDCPAGIEHGFRNAIAPADQVLIVTTPEMSAVRDADRIIGLLHAAEKADPQLIVNRLSPAMARNGEMMNVDDVVEVLRIDLLGVVPDDDSIITAMNSGEPVALEARTAAGKAFVRIAQRLLGYPVPLVTFAESPSLLQRSFNLFQHS
jgi:septum site-determining protein MinD